MASEAKATPASAPALTTPAAEVKQRVMLISIDGWGISASEHGNAILASRTPVMDSFSQPPKPGTTVLHGELEASGLAVGLPPGIMGNSEVGHLTMGCGRVDYQDLVRINMSIENKSFFENPRLVAALKRAVDGTGRLHLLGLVSDGAVHSHINHLFQFLDVAKEHKVPNTFVHFFADGRDTPPTSATKYVDQLQAHMKDKSYGSIATVMGRYYAMDRDKRWDRVKLAYEALLEGKGATKVAATELSAHIRSRYEAKENDEFLTPIVVNEEGLIRDGDTLIFINFRSDRMREIVEAIGVKPPFETSIVRKDLGVNQMTQYNSEFPLPIIFPPVSMENVLSEWLSKQGVPQFKTAETEKYAHVTFFFNGGREAQFAGEERDLVDSPRVKTYDLKPDMSVKEVAERVAKALDTGKFPFVMCNFAPPDMVGHTGVYDATKVAVEATDAAVGIVLDACQRNGYVLIVTADHGNAEEMLDAEGKVKTSHTSNLIPFNIAAPAAFPYRIARPLGGLADVAPTVLHIMGLPVPPQMTGTSMLTSTATATTADTPKPTAVVAAALHAAEEQGADAAKTAVAPVAKA